METTDLIASLKTKPIFHSIQAPSDIQLLRAYKQAFCFHIYLCADIYSPCANEESTGSLIPTNRAAAMMNLNHFFSKDTEKSEVSVIVTWGYEKPVLYHQKLVYHIF